MWESIKSLGDKLVRWWQSDALSSKSVRVPLKLAIVAGVAVVALAFGLYGAKKVSARFDEPVQYATAAQLTEFRSQIIAACSPPAPAPVKKAAATKKR